MEGKKGANSVCAQPSYYLINYEYIIYVYAVHLRMYSR